MPFQSTLCLSGTYDPVNNNAIVGAHLRFDRLMTLRSDDQFNTSVYALNGRFRGIYGLRLVLFMHADDIAAQGFASGDQVTAATVADDGQARVVKNLRVTPYDIPKGCVAGYFPECNPLLPLWHHAKDSYVPAAKSIPIRLSRS